MSVESIVWALKVGGIDPRAKLVLLGIANHDGDGGAWPAVETLSVYADCSVRTVQRHLKALVEAGLVVIHLREGGNRKTKGQYRPNLYELTFKTPEVTPDVTSGGDIAMSPEPSIEPSSPSSLRSDAVPGDQVQEICTAYYDTHKELRGFPATANWNVLRSVVRKVLKSGASNDEIVSAMLATKVMTGEGVLEQVAYRRQKTDDQIVTRAIHPVALRLTAKWEGWRGERSSQRASVMQDLSTYLSWDVTDNEVAARFGGYVRAHGRGAVPTLDDLRAVPLPPVAGLSDYTPEHVFFSFANAERRMSR